MIFFQFLCLILSIFATLASSIGSESGSLSACSKFDFEQKVLEKLVCLEHKMEVYTEKMNLWEEYFSSSIKHKMKVYAEKMKLWEESFSSSQDKVVEAKKKTETFVESMREAHLQDQKRFNESFLETMEHFKLQSENKTEMYERKMNMMLDSFSFKIQELSEAERKRKNTIQVSLHQEQNRFNASFDKIVELSNRFNNSLQEIALKQQKGASYVRWGRNSCAGDATLVYNGFMAGKHFASGGDGANILCLPKDPEWNRYASGSNRLTSRLFGLEMDILDNNQAFGSSSNAKNMPCAVCKTSGRSAVLMVPGRITCYSGWHKEFSGYLVAQASQRGRTATEYICADENLESVPGGDRDDNEAVLYPVEVGGCATLKCPPYVKGRELTCAVCSQ